MSRATCSGCRRAKSVCLCAGIRPFSTSPRFVLLVHPREARNTVGTARLVRSCVSNADVIVGTGPELDREPRLLELARSPDAFPVVLYPGKDAFDLDEESFAGSFPADRGLVVLVIDGTWSHAKKMIRESRLLGSLPQMRFMPSSPSNYRIREQPGRVCMSSIEAVHATLERLARSPRWPLPQGRVHDQLLEVFDRMVERQIELAATR